MDWSQILIYTGELPLDIILWSIYIGVAIAIIATYIIKTKFGKFVSVLIEKEAFTPESALTLEEAGLKHSITVKIGLKSHLNYKDLLVAVTVEGKFYADCTYSDEAPEIKTLKAIHRPQKSRIKTKSADETAQKTDTAINTDTIINTDTDEYTAEADPNEQAPKFNEKLDTENDEAEKKFTPYIERKKERVKFDILKAKYYIPKEVHAKVKSIYTSGNNSGKTKLLWVILGLILYAVATYFAGFVVEGLMDMLKNIGK